MDRKITESYREALADYYGAVRVSDVLQNFDGDKSALARVLAGVPLDGSLPKSGTPERTRYNSQLKAVGRYLDYERQGVKTSQNRNPQNAAAQQKLQQAQAVQNPPSGMSVTISGEICVSEDCRDRTVTIDSGRYPFDVNAFMIAIYSGDEASAFTQVFSNYCKNMSVKVLDDIEIGFIQE